MPIIAKLGQSMRKSQESINACPIQMMIPPNLSKGYQAENLLKPEGTSKWKCASAGEKQVTCTLQFEFASKISQIDIGNESSAFVEVLVGRSSGQEDFQVILVASSFMSPSESRAGQNPQRVRIFSSDKFSNAVVEEKWDRVKIVCTQPFNKTSKYGLSFIKFHAPSDGPQPPKQTLLGAFKVKSADSSSDMKVGSLFASRNKEKVELPGTPLSGAAAVRAASRQADEARNAGADRYDNGRPSTSSPTVTSTSTTPQSAKRKHSSTREEPSSTSKDPKPKLHRRSQSSSSVSSEKSRTDDVPPVKRSRSDPEKGTGGKPLRHLMKKVVFVMSGFQNPLRGELRDTAIEMGATYKPDWSDTCTHLICAFTNTPKYNQVKGHGRIVTKEWITRCHHHGKLLPWRKYRLGNASSPPASSDEEMADQRPPVKKKSVPKPDLQSMEVEEERSKGKGHRGPAVEEDNDNSDIYSVSTDVSGEDTGDEIDRIKAADSRETNKGSSSTSKAGSTPPPRKSSSTQQVIELFGDSTDEEEDDGELPELPDFFTKKHFFLYGSFPKSEKRSIHRYIIAYDGKIEEYMNDKVHFVLTNSQWDETFDDALADNPNLTFVKPAWVFACNEKQKIVPHQKFNVIPS